jgi:hypothetical protein
MRTCPVRGLPLEQSQSRGIDTEIVEWEPLPLQVVAIGDLPARLSF